MSDRPIGPVPRASARNGRDRNDGTTGRADGNGDGRGPRDGRLIPRADPVTGVPGWQALTVSRRVAAAAARAAGGTVHPLGPGEWQARIPGPDIAVTVINADSGALLCRLGGQPDSVALDVAFIPWTLETVLKCSVTQLPADGTLSVRDVRVATRMGRTVRYLIPQFATPS